MEKELKNGRYKTEIYAIIEFSFYEKLKLGVCNLLKQNPKLFLATIGTIGSYFGFGLLALLIPGLNLFEVIGGIFIGIITSLSIFIFGKLINKEKLLKKNYSIIKNNHDS